MIKMSLNAIGRSIELLLFKEKYDVAGDGASSGLRLSRCQNVNSTAYNIQITHKNNGFTLFLLIQ